MRMSSPSTTSCFSEDDAASAGDVVHGNDELAHFGHRLWADAVA
ncbi:MAG: hypothetical protein Q7U97_11470 [Rhodocyclaceae bacterium]|nr:hypothetical protein [Rhodocyclaceae bacterium]